MATSWYVLRSKPNKEEFFWGQLLAHQIDVYYPCVRAKADNPHTHKDKPFFPEYLFIHVDLQEITPSFLYWLPGSRGLLEFNERPVPVPEALIAAIRQQVDQINRADGELSSGLQADEAFSIQEKLLPDTRSIFEDALSGIERVHALLKILRGEQLPVGV